MPVSAAVASPRRAEMAQGAQERAGLSVAVVRLLAVALDISEGWSPAPPAATLLIPLGYRDWPSVTSAVESRGDHVRRGVRALSGRPRILSGQALRVCDGEVRRSHDEWRGDAPV